MTVGDHMHSLNVAVAAARADERSQDCRDICGYCRQGLKPVRRGPGKWTHAREELTGVELVCAAGAIHERQFAAAAVVPGKGYTTP